MRPETALQRAILARIAQWGLFAVHVPNGATLSGTPQQRARQMHNLKLDGLCVGFADLIVYGPGGTVGHIEVKCEGSYQQPSQKAVQKRLEDLGHLYAVCRSPKDVSETFAKWGWRPVGPGIPAPGGGALYPVTGFSEDLDP